MLLSNTRSNVRSQRKPAEYCDAVILKGNGDLLKTVLPTVGVKTATMSDINDRVALDIAGLTHPVLPHDSSVDMDVDVGLITSSVVEGSCKFIDLRSAWTKDMSKTTPMHEDYKSQIRYFSMLGRSCAQRVPRKDLEMREIFTAKSHVIARGFNVLPPLNSSDDVDPYLPVKIEIYNSLDRGYKFMSSLGTSPPLSYTFSSSPSLLSRPSHECSLTVLSLRSDVASNVRSVISTAQDLYCAGAYVHYYEREGVEKDDWKEAFENAWQIVECYEELFDL